MLYVFKTIKNKKGHGTIKGSQISIILVGKMSTQGAGQDM